MLAKPSDAVGNRARKSIWRLACHAEGNSDLLSAWQSVCGGQEKVVHQEAVSQAVDKQGVSNS